MGKDGECWCCMVCVLRMYDWFECEDELVWVVELGTGGERVRSVNRDKPQYSFTACEQSAHLWRVVQVL